jgi:hypothetical protein
MEGLNYPHHQDKRSGEEEGEGKRGFVGRTDRLDSRKISQNGRQGCDLMKNHG